jgi:hypothetical protein
MSAAARMDSKQHKHCNNLHSSVSPTSPAPLSKSDTDCTSLNPTKARRDAPSIFQPVLLFAPSSRNLYTHHPLAWRRARNNNAWSQCLALRRLSLAPACNKATKQQLSYAKDVVPLFMFAYEEQIDSLSKMLSVESLT